MELLFGLFLIFFGAKIFGAILAAVVGIVGFFFSLAAQFAGFILSAFALLSSLSSPSVYCLWPLRI